MMKRHEVQVLLKASLPQAEAARIAGLSERTVRSIEAEPTVAEVDDGAERQRRRMGRPSKTEPSWEFVVDLLEQKPELVFLKILRRVRLEGYSGGKTPSTTSWLPCDPRSGARFRGAGAVVGSVLSSF